VTKKTKKFDALFAGLVAKQTKPGQRCRCCANPEVAEILAEYAQRKAAGDHLPALYYLHRELIHPQHGISYTSVRNHSTYCLGMKP